METTTTQKGQNMKDDRNRVGMHRIHGKSMYLGHYGMRKDATRTREARRATKARRQARAMKAAV